MKIKFLEEQIGQLESTSPNSLLPLNSVIVVIIIRDFSVFLAAIAIVFAAVAA